MREKIRWYMDAIRWLWKNRRWVSTRWYMKAICWLWKSRRWASAWQKRKAFDKDMKEQMK